MIGPCPFLCSNKTSLGYCKTTGCINPSYYKKVYHWDDSSSNTKFINFFIDEDDEVEE